MKKLLTVFCCAILIAACAGKEMEETASQLAEKGGRYFEDEKYQKAKEAYKRLKDWYPYSPHARKALLRVAESHYHLGEYPEAIFNFEQYEQLYPDDPEIPYVIYRIGRCHYERLRSIDRTQVPARNALDTFERLRTRFPASEYAEKAQPLIEECLENLAGHEFYVGRHYFKSGHYRAAVNRFENVISRYPDNLEVHGEATEYLSMAKKKMAEQGDAPKRRERGVGLHRIPEDDPRTLPEPSPEPSPRPPR